MNRSRRLCLPIFAWAVGILLMTCNGPRTLQESESVSPTLRDPGVIALVPFFVSRPDTPGQQLVRCPRCEGYMTVGEIAPEAPQVITSLFRRALSRDGYTLIAPEMVDKLLPALVNLEENPEVLAKTLASPVKANTVLMGWIFRYKERIGSDWGAREPASVAFAVFLFDGQNGRMLWRTKFDETQRPLSENVLGLPAFLRRGGRWVDASGLASDGVNVVLMKFPGRAQIRVNR